MANIPNTKHSLQMAMEVTEQRSLTDAKKQIWNLAITRQKDLVQQKINFGYTKKTHLYNELTEIINKVRREEGFQRKKSLKYTGKMF